ncbi:MAG TPA: hypothetical protein VKE42_04875 [Candidatus Cybelea sp.]|nr:hypothetical protein [Candidatus Cybelea sp.]
MLGRSGGVIIDRSERAVIDMIARGVLRARKSDRRTLIEVASLREYAESLPRPVLRPDNRERRKRK